MRGLTIQSWAAVVLFKRVTGADRIGEAEGTESEGAGNGRIPSI